MIQINKKKPSSSNEIDEFIKKYKSKLPMGFLDFYKNSNGANIYSKERYILLFNLSEFAFLKEIYEDSEEGLNYFFFASDGSGMWYLIQKKTGYIYEIPFEGEIEEIRFICKTFTEFIEEFPLTPI